MNSLVELNKKSLELLVDKTSTRIDRCHLIFDKSLPDLLYQHMCDYAFRYTDSQFELWPTQIQLLNVLTNERLVLVAKHRRAGETFCTAMYLAHELINRPNINILVISGGIYSAQSILDIVSQFLNSVNTERSGLPYTGTKNCLKLKNGSTITAITPNITNMIGKRYDIIHIDEAAHIYNLAEIYSVAIYGMKYEGQLIVTSTPNGNNFFSELMNGGITNAEPFYMLNPYLDPKNLEDMGRY